MGERRGSLVGSLCSRNAHDETVVVRRAQWGTNQGRPSGKDDRASSEGFDSDGARSMRAVKGSLDTPSLRGRVGIGRVGEKDARSQESVRLLPCFLHLLRHECVGVGDDVYPIPAVAFYAVEGVVGHLA